MGEAVEVLERHGELELAIDVRTKLLQISAATIDRALAPERKRLQVRGRSGTKPGSILNRQIPIRTFAEWDDRRPGFWEIDLVAHDGGAGIGKFCQTLDLVCVATGWRRCGRSRSRPSGGCSRPCWTSAECLPFPLLGLDCDNGGEFINVELFRYCEQEGITFTRSRPYRKNDNCFVEQKNWPVVCQQVGYHRYDTSAELDALRDLYRYLRLYVNFFQPQMKLVSKSGCRWMTRAPALTQAAAHAPAPRPTPAPRMVGLRAGPAQACLQQHPVEASPLPGAVLEMHEELLAISRREDSDARPALPPARRSGT
jgi:hypothetical protein